MNILSLNPNVFLLPKHKTFGNSGIRRADYCQNYDTVNISFGAKDFSNVKKINLDNAIEISGIHCPGCGIKMLSQKDFDNLMLRAENIHSTVEFVQLLKEYRKSIPNSMRKILSGTDNVEDYKDFSILDYYNIHKREAFLKRQSRIRAAREILRDYAPKVPEAKREDYLNKVNEIHSNDAYYPYKMKVYNAIEFLNIPQNERNQLVKKVLKDPATSSSYFSIFHINNVKDLPENELAKTLVKNIFSNSIIRTAPIEKYPDYINHPHNELLLCDNCNENSSRYAFWKNDSNPRLKDNMVKYLTDISRLMGENKIAVNNGYFKSFCHFVNVVSANKISFDEKYLERFNNIHYLTGRHENFEPIMQSKVDIPCACCNSTLLPHEVRSNIEDDLFDCDSPYEYAQVLKKYQKYIGVYAKHFSEIFLNIVENNPAISSEKFMREFRTQVDMQSKKELKHAIYKYSKAREYIAQNRSLSELYAYDELGTKVYKYVKSGKLDDFYYTNFFNTCCCNIDLRHTPKAVSQLIDEINTICYKNHLTRINDYSMDDKDAIYTVLFNMFKSDVATADHLVAAVKGGKKTKDNLIGLCKGCNTLKSNRSVKSWYNLNLGVRKNMINQLNTINQMSKSGELEGYENWAKDIAQTMYEKTDKAFDLRDKI